MHKHVGNDLDRLEQFGFWEIKPKYPVQINLKYAVYGPISEKHYYVNENQIFNNRGYPDNPLPNPFIFIF